MAPAAVNQRTPEASSQADLCLSEGNERRKNLTLHKKARENQKPFSFVIIFQSKIRDYIRIAGSNRLAEGGQSRGVDLEGSYEGRVYILSGCHLIQQQS